MAVPVVPKQMFMDNYPAEGAEAAGPSSQQPQNVYASNIDQSSRNSSGVFPQRKQRVVTRLKSHEIGKLSSASAGLLLADAERSNQPNRGNLEDVKQRIRENKTLMDSKSILNSARTQSMGNLYPQKSQKDLNQYSNKNPHLDHTSRTQRQSHATSTPQRPSPKSRGPFDTPYLNGGYLSKADPQVQKVHRENSDKFMLVLKKNVSSNVLEPLPGNAER